MTLAELITLHRDGLRSEMTMKMTTSAVPSQTEEVGGLQVTDAGELGGPSLSVPFARYLHAQLNIDRRTNHPSSTPVSAAIGEVRYACRTSHRDHTDRPEWGGSLCHRLVVWVVYWGFSVQTAARMCGIDVASAEKWLGGTWDDTEQRWRGGALRRMTDFIDRRRALTSEKAEPEDTSPTRLSRAICEAVNREVRDFAVEQRIWEAMRYRDPTLRSWEDEWAARQAKILEHRTTCERCRIEEAA